MAYQIPNIDLSFSRLLPRLILASKSPARKALLEASGCSVVAIPTNSDEYHGLIAGKEVVHYLAQKKLDAFLQTYGPAKIPILAADTLVGYNGKLIGKAKSEAEAKEHISLLAGQTHSVFSGFSLWFPPSAHREAQHMSGSDETLVTFRNIDAEELITYIASNDWLGAAGSYRIQGLANSFIIDVKGDYATVVGLPIRAISAILSAPGCLYNTEYPPEGEK